MQTVPRIFLASFVGSSLLLFAQTADPTQPPANQNPILTVQGRGSQIYSCQLAQAGFQWIFRAPAARLFNAEGSEVGIHGDGPIWIAQDSSAIHGTLLATAASPEATSVPWLLLKARDPQRTGILTNVEFIRRSDTKGGIAPIVGCDSLHKGDLVRIPYTATYTFYSSSRQ